MADSSTGVVREKWLLFLTPVIAALAPLYQVYGANGIRLIDQAPFIYAAGVMISATLIGCALAILHSAQDWRREVIKTALLAVSLLLLIDMSGGGREMMAGITVPYGRRLLVSGAFVFLFGVLWVMRRKAPVILFIGALGLCLSTIVVSPGVLFSSANAQEARSEPPVIYIIVDEMIGVEGIPRDIPGGEEAYSSVRSLFLDHGFKLYTRAFSRHFMSQRSIPAALNFNENDDDGYDRSKYLDLSRKGAYSLRLLERWEDEGELLIYQSGHLNWCASIERAKCRTFPSFDAASWSPSNDPADVFKSRLAAHSGIMKEAFSGSYAMSAYSNLVLLYTTGHSVPTVPPEFFDIHAFPEWFEQFSEEVRQGEADRYFAHFLMPHAPSVLNSQCKPEERWESPYYLTEQKKLTGAELDEARSKYYGWYFEQVACLTRTLDAFLSDLEQTPGFEDATIIIHGDHGSRISAGRLPEHQTSRDLIDNYSTLYAIKAPNVDAGVDLRQASVQRFTAEYLGDKSIDALGPENLTVITGDGKKGGSVEFIPMPALPSNGQKAISR